MGGTLDLFGEVVKRSPPNHTPPHRARCVAGAGYAQSCRGDGTGDTELHILCGLTCRWSSLQRGSNLTSHTLSPINLSSLPINFPWLIEPLLCVALALALWRESMTSCGRCYLPYAPSALQASWGNGRSVHSPGCSTQFISRAGFLVDRPWTACTDPPTVSTCHRQWIDGSRDPINNSNLLNLYYIYFSKTEDLNPLNAIFPVSEAHTVTVRNFGGFCTDVRVFQAYRELGGRIPCGQSVDFAPKGDRVNRPWIAMQSLYGLFSTVLRLSTACPH